jgi:DNA-dependent RNA polymerase auxiliary subunit epsilon
MDLSAKIKGIKYKPLLCQNLKIFEFKDLEIALESCTSFILKINEENRVAISWWVSAKRTRSYPYARVYDTLGFTGRKITIIPIFKDEGKEGDRDFLQWDTVLLMSLLGVYVIVAYYIDAKRNKRYRHKITNQRFDINYIREQIKNILSYQSDALHWNLQNFDKISQIGQKALEAYEKISKKLKVQMHSRKSAEKRIAKLLESKEEFIRLSRALAKKAQEREKATVQPKENLSGKKAIITIQNYLGGYYYFTVDEVEIKDNQIFLVEAKHSKTNALPSLEDIKDGLLKMILFTNLESVKFNDKEYVPVAVLKLTVEGGFNENRLSSSQKEILKLLYKEAEINNFQIILR